MARRSEVALFQKANGSQRVVHLSLPVVVTSSAEPDTTKIETQHLTTKAKESLGGCKNYFVVHGALVQRMRMADHSERRRFSSLPKLEQTFDASRGTFELNALDFVHISGMSQARETEIPAANIRHVQRGRSA